MRAVKKFDFKIASLIVRFKLKLNTQYKLYSLL